MTDKRTLLGFDYGQKRIGIAVGQELTNSASALITINNQQLSKFTWSEIDKLIEQWKPGLLIVGLPINMDDSVHALHGTVKDFGNMLKQRYSIEVEWIDERLSSIEAENALAQNHSNAANKNRGSGKKQRHNKADIDKLAAKFILQSWLNQPR